MSANWASRRLSSCGRNSSQAHFTAASAGSGPAAGAARPKRKVVTTSTGKRFTRDNARNSFSSARGPPPQPDLTSTVVVPCRAIACRHFRTWLAMLLALDVWTEFSADAVSVCAQARRRKSQMGVAVHEPRHHHAPGRADLHRVTRRLQVLHPARRDPLPAPAHRGSASIRRVSVPDRSARTRGGPPAGRAW